jgi:hypothetical protein
MSYPVEGAVGQCYSYMSTFSVKLCATCSGIKAATSETRKRILLWENFIMSSSMICNPHPLFCG